MKIIRIMLGVALLAGASATFSSCQSEEQRLAEKLQGVWAGTPETFTNDQTISATITDNYIFSPDTVATTRGNLPSGVVTVESAISMNTSIIPQGDLVEPLSLTAAALSTISGTWTVTDDDEISIALDPKTLSVAVDPDAIKANGNIIGTNGGTTTVDSLKPDVAANLTMGLQRSLAIRYAKLRQMDDVKIKGNLMKFEIGETDYVLTRESQKL